MSAPTFTKHRDGTYGVLYKGTRYGFVWRNGAGVWITQHRDGTAGPGARTRIEAAWALLNA